VARFTLPDRLRRLAPNQSAEPHPLPDSPPTPIVRRAPTPGALRRERRAILRAREEMIRDLGGLMLEMYRHEQFREDLIEERCREIVNLEARIYELDSMLSAVTASRAAPAGRCTCGAPVIWGSHFCAHCGRPTGGAPAVACTQCGHPLAADAEFCPSCGKAAEVPPDEQPVATDMPATENGAGAAAGDPDSAPEEAPPAESWDS